MHEMMALHSILECAWYFIRECGQDLVFVEIEFHLLILKDLAKSRRIEKVNKNKGSLVKFHIVAICLDSILDPLDYILVGILARL